jgi:hypothetical protein
MQIHSAGLDLGKTTLHLVRSNTSFAATNGRVRNGVLTLIIQYH